MDESSVTISVCLLGIIYYVYGKSRNDKILLYSGAVMIVTPWLIEYFFDCIPLLVILGLLGMASPFIAEAIDRHT